MATEKRLFDGNSKFIEKYFVKRLIEREELLADIEILYQEHYAKSYDKTIHDIFNAVRRRIRRCPTVDAVEVVRCKDCRHYHADTLSCDFTPYSQYYERPNWYEEDYCSYGERKDNE